MENKKLLNINDLIGAVKGLHQQPVETRASNSDEESTGRLANYFGPQLVNDKVAAQILGVSDNTLAVWRSTKRYGLRFYKIGGRVRYRVSDLKAWLETRASHEA